MPFAEAAKFSLYRPETIALAVGDKIRFTATVKTGRRHKLANGATHTVAGFTEAGDIKLGNGWVVPASAGHFRSGFVETSLRQPGQDGATGDPRHVGRRPAGDEPGADVRFRPAGPGSG